MSSSEKREEKATVGNSKVKEYCIFSFYSKRWLFNQHVWCSRENSAKQSTKQEKESM